MSRTQINAGGQNKATINYTTFAIYCGGRNCVNSLQRNHPADYKSGTRTVNHESDLLSCEISLRVHVLIWQMNCSSLSLRFHLAIFILLTNIRSSCWEERNENAYDMTILSTSLSRRRQCKARDARCRATAYSILNFAGQARQAKGQLKNINGQINVSGLLVFYQLIFMVNLPQNLK